jgi:hypothetical protein
MFISGIQIPDPKACPADKQTATQDREQSQFSQRRAERNPGVVIATSRIKGHTMDRKTIRLQARLGAIEYMIAELFKKFY